MIDSSHAAKIIGGGSHATLFKAFIATLEKEINAYLTEKKTLNESLFIVKEHLKEVGTFSAKEKQYTREKINDIGKLHKEKNLDQFLDLVNKTIVIGFYDVEKGISH